jgi:hypothetical protein
MWFKLVIRFVALIWDWAWPIRGLWRILDGKDESGLFSCLELRGGSPRLCQLRTSSVGPCVTSIDYVMAHTGFMGSLKFSSFDGRQVGRYITSPAVIYKWMVYGPPTNSPVYGITWKTCTRERWDPTWLFDRCHELRLHVGSGRPHVCRVARFFPRKMYIYSNLHDTLGYGWWLGRCVQT